MLDAIVSRQKATEQAVAQEKANTDGPGFDTSILIRANSPVLGPADAPVTLVEFFDLSCEACRYFHPILKRLRSTFQNELRVFTL